jgi:hypothetical protein
MTTDLLQFKMYVKLLFGVKMIFVPIIVSRHARYATNLRCYDLSARRTCERIGREIASVCPPVRPHLSTRELLD